MCSCGKSKTSVPKTFYVIDSEGAIIGTFSSEMDAMMESSQNPGSKVRPAVLSMA